MSELYPTLFIIGIFFIGWLVMHSHFRRERQKRELPLREEYAAAHGGSITSCHACGKTDLKDDGLNSGQDSRRVVSCNGCETLLYRYEREEEEETAVAS